MSDLRPNRLKEAERPSPSPAEESPREDPFGASHEVRPRRTVTYPTEPSRIEGYVIAALAALAVLVGMVALALGLGW